MYKKAEKQQFFASSMQKSFSQLCFLVKISYLCILNSCNHNYKWNKAKV